MCTKTFFSFLVKKIELADELRFEYITVQYAVGTLSSLKEPESAATRFYVILQVIYLI